MAYVIAEPCIGSKDSSRVEVCLVDTVFAQDQLPGEWKRFGVVNAEYHREAASSSRVLESGNGEAFRDKEPAEGSAGLS